MIQRIFLALRLWRDKGLSYTWARAWRRSGDIGRQVCL